MAIWTSWVQKASVFTTKKDFPTQNFDDTMTD